MDSNGGTKNLLVNLSPNCDFCYSIFDIKLCLVYGSGFKIKVHNSYFNFCKQILFQEFVTQAFTIDKSFCWTTINLLFSWTLLINSITIDAVVVTHMRIEKT